MKRTTLLAAALPCLLASALAQGVVDHERVARGDGPEAPIEAGLVELKTQEALSAYTDASLEDGYTYALVALGNQPAETEFTAVKVVEQDKYGWDVRLRVEVRSPYRTQIKRMARPYLLLRFKGRPMRMEHSVQVTLTVGEIQLDAMPLERALKARDTLQAMSRSQRRLVRKLHDENLALRAQLRQLEQDTLTFSESDAFSAALGAVDFRTRIRYAVDLASLKTDLQLFGGTMNPLVSSGDESLAYLPKSKQAWTAELEKDYAFEAEYLRKAIDELQGELDGMRSFAARHAPAAEPSKGEGEQKVGIADEVRGR